MHVQVYLFAGFARYPSAPMDMVHIQSVLAFAAFTMMPFGLGVSLLHCSISCLASIIFNIVISVVQNSGKFAIVHEVSKLSMIVSNIK